MKQTEIKNEVIRVLKAEMDSWLKAEGFHRPPKGLAYSRSDNGSRCEFAVEFASNPSYARDCLAHLTPSLRIASPRISEVALQLVEDRLLLAGSPELIQGRRLTMLNEPQMPEWYVADVSQLAEVIQSIREVFFKHGLPFLNDYHTASGIVRQHEAGDCRALRQQHYYVYVIAAYLVQGKIEAAHAVLQEKFSKPGVRKKFSNLWKNMNGYPSSTQ